LETGQIRLLHFIAENGPMNITELGKKNSRYTLPGFDRWGVKDRIKGSSKFLSLIDFDYMYEIKINKKEKRYGLTTKGLLFTLNSLPFESNYLIIQYKKFLQKFLDKKNVKLIIEFIKFEIAYVLFYNTLEGINWKKFKSIPLYFEKQRLPGKTDSFHVYFETDHLKLDQTDKDNLEKIKQSYSNLHRWCWYEVTGSSKLKKTIEPEQIFREWKKSLLKGTKFKEEYKKNIIYNLYCRYWPSFMIDPDFTVTLNDLVWTYFEIRRFDVRPKLVNMKKKDYEKLLANKKIRKLLSSMFYAVRIN